MKLTTYTFAIAMTLPLAAYAGPNASQQISALPNGAVKSALIELNAEDQRVTDGTYNAATGTLTLYTQDMKAGSDGNISRRAVVIEGIRAVNGADGKDGKDGRNGQDFNAAGHAAALASATALGGLQFQSLSEGQAGWAAGIGGQTGGDAAFAVGINYGVTDDISINASIASTFDGNGVSAFIGASGRF